MSRIPKLRILIDSTGDFMFMSPDYKYHIFNDYNKIPEDFKILEVIRFLPNIPPPPHTVQQHEEIHMWDKLFKDLMSSVYNK